MSTVTPAPPAGVAPHPDRSHRPRIQRSAGRRLGEGRERRLPPSHLGGGRRPEDPAEAGDVAAFVAQRKPCAAGDA